MVASRLHATVSGGSAFRKSIAALYDAGVLTCTKMAQCDWDVPGESTDMLAILQYQIEASAYKPPSISSGQFPRESASNPRNDLLKIIGIGPVMAVLVVHYQYVSGASDNMRHLNLHVSVSNASNFLKE
jgi:hypothetical protein